MVTGQNKGALALTCVFISSGLVGYCCCGNLGSTFSYGGSVFTIYRNTSRQFRDVNDFCVNQGHDGIAHLCQPDDLTEILPPGNNKELLWIKGPTTCSVFGLCLSVWFDSATYPGWVTMCSRCQSKRYFMCESRDQSPPATGITGLPASTTTLPSTSRLSVCNETVITGTGLDYVIVPVLLTYNRATQFCNGRYHKGRLLDSNEATNELATLTSVAKTNAVSHFWLYKETGNGQCNVMTPSGIVQTSCSLLNGVICTRHPGQFSSRKLSNRVSIEEIFTDFPVMNVISTDDVMRTEIVRSLVECASGCTINPDCQSFFFVSNTGLCQTHKNTLTPDSGVIEQEGARYFIRNHFDD